MKIITSLTLILLTICNTVSALQSGGTAFTCPAAKWSGQKSDFYYHFTLTHISTRDKKIVKLARKIIDGYINTEVSKGHNGRRSLSWYQVSTGKNSLFIAGEVEDFKQNLHNHLMQDSTLSPYISSYKTSHIDVQGNFSKKLYDKFTIDQIIERKTP